MTKILFFPSSLKQIKDVNDLVDGFILSVTNLSINSLFTLNINDIEELTKKYSDKEIFVSLNKNMFNNDLNQLEDVLIKLSNFNIAGVLYYDISVLSIVKRLKLNIHLVWSQEHLTTNYLTCNFYEDRGCKYTYLSGEITLKEILEIREKTDMKLIVPIFGYLPMFASIRHIVNNYLDYFDLKNNSEIKYMVKENNKYPIIDNNLGTVAYSSHILNGLDEYLELKKRKIDYVTINSFNIDDEKIKKVLSLYKDVDANNKDEYNEKLKKMFYNLDKGFLYKETIYKVK